MVASGLDDRGYGLTPFGVAEPDHQGIIDAIVQFERFFDFFWENLFTGCVNTVATAAQEREGAVCFDLNPVAWN